MALARCHGNLDTSHPGCYHPGPGVLPPWASDLAVIGLILVILVGGYFAVWAVARCRYPGKVCLRMSLALVRYREHYIWVCGKHEDQIEREEDGAGHTDLSRNLHG